MRARQAQQAPAKKLTIKPLRPPSVPADFDESTWLKLQAAVRAVHGKQPVASSLEELYRAVEDRCTHKLAPSTYERLEQECERHTERSLRALDRVPADAAAFLPLVHACWADHCEQSLLVRAIFLYLDRTYLLQTAGVRPLWEMGLAHFRAHLVALPDVLGRTVSALLEQIERERLGEHVDRSLLHNVCRMFSALSIYAERLEGPLVERTAAFYAAEATRLLGTTGVPEYLAHVDARLAEEGARCAQLLHASSRRPLLGALHAALIAPHVDTLLERGLDALVDEGRADDLRRLYSLLGHVGAHRKLRDAWSAHIKRVGSELVQDSERDKTQVEELLALKAKCDGLHVRAFERSEPFGYALREAFESFINTRQNRPAELIAKFLDGQLRAGAKGSAEAEIEAALDRALALFRFINGKDMFEAFYKKDLAKRLLIGRSASIDAEKLMISKLKAECGAGFTNKLEGMFRDVELSADLMGAYRQALAAGKLPGSEVELSVHVLTMGFWPPYPPAELKLPPELAVLQERFTSFYLGKHSGRRVQWCHALGHCLVRAHFPLGVHELQLSLLQTAVCVLFNDADTLSLPEIADATGIEDRELRLTLQSLACGKVRVLTKEPKGREVEDGDTFSFNAELQHKLYRLKINAIQLKESAAEHEQTEERVFVDRQYQIDAAIVRVMKARKSLSHTLLMSELFAQLKFPLKPTDLKKRVESLIDREYLERDASNPQVYRYLA